MGTSCLCLTGFFFFCFNANSSGIETITWGLKTFLISISSIGLCNTLMIPLISSKFSIVPPLSYHVGYDQPPLLSLLTPCHTPPLQSPPGQFPLQGKNPKKVNKDIVHKCAHLRRFYLLQSWKNEFLTWNSSKYGDLQRVHFSPEEIWVPDTALFNK